MKTKVCSRCKIDKPHSEYYKDNIRKIGIRCKCKACCSHETKTWRERNRSEYNNYVAMWRAKNPERQYKTEIKRRYGLSLKRYNEMLSLQGQSCAICGAKHQPNEKRGRLYVDHCHSTKKVRALLCGACNSMIGYANDSVSTLEKAIFYLKRHS